MNSGVRFGISVTIKDAETIIITLYIDGEKLAETETKRVSDEISAENATLLVAINTERVTEMILSAE